MFDFILQVASLEKLIPVELYAVCNVQRCTRYKSGMNSPLSSFPYENTESNPLFPIQTLFKWNTSMTDIEVTTIPELHQHCSWGSSSIYFVALRAARVPLLPHHHSFAPPGSSLGSCCLLWGCGETLTIFQNYLCLLCSSVLINKSRFD